MRSVASFTGLCALVALTAVIFFPRPSEAVVCNPPTVITGCTMSDSDNLVISATVVATTPTITPPTVTTSPAADGITETTATIYGTVQSLNNDTSADTFGFTGSFGSPVSVAGSTSTVPYTFSYAFTGLTCGTVYTYTAGASNSAGPSTGTASNSFTTTSCAAPIPVLSPGGGGTVTTTTVNFSGLAYPGARVTILEDGKIIVQSIAGGDGRFVATTAGIMSGSYVFSAYAEDSRGDFSSTYSFPFQINASSIVNIRGIFLSPTIVADKLSVKQGEDILLSGFSAPGAAVSIDLGSPAGSRSYSAVADTFGAYRLSLNTGLLAPGSYVARARASQGGVVSPDSKRISFIVTYGKTIIKKPGIESDGTCYSLRGDINCDGRVNIIDFSIMKSWYRNRKPQPRVDLNSDGAVDLADFSILSSNWTG